MKLHLNSESISLYSKKIKTRITSNLMGGGLEIKKDKKRQKEGLRKPINISVDPEQNEVNDHGHQKPRCSKKRMSVSKFE